MRPFMRAFVLTLLMVALVAPALGQEAEPKPAEQPTPTLDRSAEPALREVLRTYGAMRDLHLWVRRTSQDTPGGQFLVNKVSELWYRAPGKFRAADNAYFGGGALIVSDGKDLLIDRLVVGQAATLRDAPANFRTGGNELRPNASGTIYMMLLDGEEAFDTLVDAKSDVKFTEAGRFDRAIAFKGTFGDTVLYLNDQPELRVTRIEFGRQARNRVVLTRDDVYEFELGRTFPEWAFDTQPSGVEIRDSRKTSEGQVAAESGVEEEPGEEPEIED